MGLSRFIPACAGNAWTGLLHGQDVPVHPRMRGERSSRSGPGVASHGSSLHARGTPLDGQPRFALTRFIPACAGNAVLRLSLQPWIPVHPRMRGERPYIWDETMASFGSSPHARGTQIDSRRCASASRFIPACAGNARSGHPKDHHLPVHPRMRGERMRRAVVSTFRFGSSPHARGTLLGGFGLRPEPRFIPACAGNAPPSDRPVSPPAVHPRMRGERPYIWDETMASFGSSPHARGTHAGRIVQERGSRFIPACAGNARPWRRRSDKASVHPRMRGERLGEPVVNPDGGGSSPHARGTHLLGLGHGLVQRFIPAYAGNAFGVLLNASSISVHPRMRGERLAAMALWLVALGSSPHARGTRANMRPCRSMSRFIPACAGNAHSAGAWAVLGAVHPRMRGERSGRTPVTIWKAGSSPHARGTLGIWPNACVASPVHPRMRGERNTVCSKAIRVFGSSPHARGTRGAAWAGAARWRFIPACAGNALPTRP